MTSNDIERAEVLNNIFTSVFTVELENNTATAPVEIGVPQKPLEVTPEMVKKNEPTEDK